MSNDDSFAGNNASDPHSGQSGYTQAEDGSWVPNSFYSHGSSQVTDPDYQAARLVRALRSGDKGDPVIMGKVVSIQGKKCTVTLQGETAPHAGINRVNSYHPAVGDGVYMVKVRSALFIMGTIEHSDTKGEVTSIDTDAFILIMTIDGVTGITMPYLQSYKPTVGDIAYTHLRGDEMVAIGKNADTVDDTGGGIGLTAGVVGTVTAWDDALHTVSLILSDDYTFTDMPTIGWYYGVVGDVVYCLNFGTVDEPNWLCLGSAVKMTSYTIPHDDTSPFVPGA